MVWAQAPGLALASSLELPFLWTNSLFLSAGMNGCGFLSNRSPFLLLSTLMAWMVAWPGRGWYRFRAWWMWGERS